ncbi:MAG: hypothetical protein ACJ72Z_06105 [Pyrinomonadaceae bacterium]
MTASATTQLGSRISIDSYIIGHRWWSLTEIEHSDEEFAPRRLAEFLQPILHAEYTYPPIDCGV